MYPDDFRAFWCLYPRKRSKGDALRAWEQTADFRPPLAELLEHLYGMCCSEDWRRDRGQWIPYPATWLRAHGWEDAPSVDLPPLRDAETDVGGWRTREDFRAMRERFERVMDG